MSINGLTLTNADTVNLVGTIAGEGTITTTVRLSYAFQTFTFRSGWHNLVSLKITASTDAPSGPNVVALLGIDNVVLTEFRCLRRVLQRH